jgi:hypothetical protein
MGLPQSNGVKIKSITYLSDLSEVNPEHDNLDVHMLELQGNANVSVIPISMGSLVMKGLSLGFAYVFQEYSGRVLPGPACPALRRITA